MIVGELDVRLVAELHAAIPHGHLGYSNTGAVMVRVESRAAAARVIEVHRDRGSNPGQRWDIYTGDALIETVRADDIEQVREYAGRVWGTTAAVCLRIVQRAIRADL